MNKVNVKNELREIAKVNEKTLIDCVYSKLKIGIATTPEEQAKELQLFDCDSMFGIDCEFIVYTDDNDLLSTFELDKNLRLHKIIEENTNLSTATSVQSMIIKSAFAKELAQHFNNKHGDNLLKVISVIG